MNDSQRSEFLRHVRELLDSHQVGVLGTRFEGAPHLSLVAFAASDDLREIYFASPAVVPRYLGRHPGLAGFVASPSCRFFRIRVQRCSLVRRFQDVEELTLA